MPYQLGYACINNVLRNQKIRANRRAIKRTFYEKGLSYIGELVAQNLKDLHTILEWNHKHDKSHVSAHQKHKPHQTNKINRQQRI